MIDPKKIIVALDGMTKSKALTIADRLSGVVWGFKVNDLLYEDVSITNILKKCGGIFIDVKLHDIPNTVSNSVRRLSDKGADIITVHASGGIEMMMAAKEAANETRIVAVTVLTSQRRPDAQSEVKRLTKDALEAGMDGIVASGQELEEIHTLSDAENLLKIIPGVRPRGYRTADDQARIVTPKEAVLRGADFLVIGRPLTEAEDPVISLEKLCDEVDGGIF